MTSSHPEDRIRLSIELALTAKDTQRQETQDAEARALGMSGAAMPRTPSTMKFTRRSWSSRSTIRPPSLARQ